MLQKDIFEKFKILFPMYSQAVTTWFPNGKGSIRVRLGEVNGDFVFTFKNNNEWKFTYQYTKTGIDIISTRISKYIIAFHTKEQAEEFLSYPENIQLLKDYFMIDK